MGTPYIPPPPKPRERAYWELGEVSPPRRPAQAQPGANRPGASRPAPAVDPRWFAVFVPIIAFAVATGWFVASHSDDLDTEPPRDLAELVGKCITFGEPMAPSMYEDFDVTPCVAPHDARISAAAKEGECPTGTVEVIDALGPWVGCGVSIGPDGRIASGDV